MADCWMGIEIGGTKLQVVTGSSSGEISDRRRLTADSHLGGAGIRSQIKQIVSTLLPLHHPKAIAVGFGGPVDRRTGTVCCSNQVEGWHDFPLKEWLSSLTGLPVALENDANTAALAEATLGAGKGSDPCFYMNMGSGVGGGIVSQGRIFHGRPPGEAEIGHLRLDRDGTTLEARCSGWAVDQKIRTRCAHHPDSLLATITRDLSGGEARHLGHALAQKDPLANAILAETAEDLAFGLSHAVHLVHPEVVVLGGGLSLIGDPLRDAVAERLPRFLMESLKPGPPIRLAELSEDAVPVGALLIAAQTAQ